MVRRLAIVIVISGIHWLANITLLLLEMDTAGFLGLFPTSGHGLTAAVLKVIQFPLVDLLHTADPAGESWLLPVMIVNSLLWGVSLYWGFRLIRGWFGGRD